MGWFRSTATGADSGADVAGDPFAAIGPGVPGHCPECNGLGYIDSIDIGHRYQIQHCKDCQHRWEYLFDGDGHVVGVTRLDETGQPVTRSRVRRVAAAEPDEAADEVIDLRDGATAVLDLTEAERLSPADWLRQNLRR
jgi:hypothetical protein